MRGADETLVNRGGNTPEDKMGQWARHRYSIDDDYREEKEEHKDDDWHIRRMLWHAPTYRPWGRRG